MPASADDILQFVRELELDMYEIGICLACLTFVAFPLDLDDEAEARRAINHFSPVLWEEGLALPARLALERTRAKGHPLAEQAIADVERRGGRSRYVKAIVRRLGEDMVADMRSRRPAGGVVPLR